MKHIGRNRELAEVRRILSHEESGRIAIIGERGIGKSHLLEEVRKIADELGHATAYVSLDPSLTPNVLAARLMLSLEAGGSQKIVSILAEEKNRIRGGSMFGFGLSMSDKKVAYGALEEFCFMLIKGFREAEGSGFRNSAATLIIDEVDTADNEIMPIGACLKTIMEYLDFHKVMKVNLVIAGLPSMRQKIYNTHPSAWREFENIELSPLDESDTNGLIEELLAGSSAKRIREDARKEIVELSDGYPHWVRELTNEAIKASSGSDEITRHHLIMGKPEAFQRVWENYYSNDFEGLSPKAKLLLRLMAVHARDEVRVDLLEQVSGLPRSEFSDLLNTLERANIIYILEAGIYQYALMRSTAYRHKLSQIVHPLLDPLCLSEFWGDADRMLADLAIFGERDAPTYRAFCTLVGSQFDSENDIRFYEYDSTFNLFDSLREPSLVTGFRDSSVRILTSIGQSVPPQGGSSIASRQNRDTTVISKSRDEQPVFLTTLDRSERFSDIWKEADLLCIPHYMLGRVSSLGVWTFDELFGDKSDQLRNYFQFVLHDFDESCTFEAHWIAAPFTYLTKVLVSKRDVATPESWSELCEDDGRIDARIDRIPNSISFWYEWRQHLIEKQDWPIFKADRRSDDAPTLSAELNEANKELLKDGSAYSRANSCKPFFHSINSFRKLLISTADDTSGLSYWGTYKDFLGSETTFMSMWIDWAAELDHDAQRQGRQLTWYDLPSLPGSTDRNGSVQPLESWVFVIPRKASSRHHKLRAKKIAELLMSTLSMGWQLQFQQAGGCSPVAWLVSSTSAQRIGKPREVRTHPPKVGASGSVQPWNDAIARSIRQRQNRGKSRREIEFIQAETAFLTALFFSSKGNLADELGDDFAFAERFCVLFPEYVNLLTELTQQNF